MVVITLSQVPQYLRASRHFLSLNVPDDQWDQFSLDIPDGCMMPNTARINNSRDLHNFLRTIRFWKFHQHIGRSTAFLDFVFHPRNKKLCRRAFPIYKRNISELSTIQAVLLAPPPVQLVLAVQSGSLGLLRYMSTKGLGLRMEFEALCAAGRFGRMDCLQYLIQRSHHRYNVCKVAVLENNVSFLSSVIAAGAIPTKEDANAAASKGHHDCLLHLVRNGCSVDAQTAALAATYGHTECLQLLFESGKPIWPADGSDFFTFVRNSEPTASDLPCFEYVCSIGYECTAEIFINFVMGDRIDCVVWLVHNVPNLAFDACSIAAKFGSVDCLMALRSAGCECTDDICTVAASAGKANVLVYLYAESIIAGTEAITAAAENNRFSCLELLYENDCPWDETTAAAAGRGGLHCLRFVLTRGCPFPKTVANTNNVASGCEWKTLSYLHGIQFPWDESTLLAILMNNDVDKFSCLEYAILNKCPCTDVFWDAAVLVVDVNFLSRLRKVQCLIDNPAVVTTRALAN